MKLKPILLALLLVGCAKAPPPSTPMNFDQADAQANHEKQITVEGYPAFPSMAMITDTMFIELHETQDPNSRSINCSCKIGSGPNQLEKPPKDYKDSDLKLHYDDGSLVPLKTKIKVSGQVYWSPPLPSKGSPTPSPTPKVKQPQIFLTQPIFIGKT